ncbi:polynucleotide 3'-phosphatase [Penicillium alfredii]|uniref:tripeptidyl-peptidase II n=1 Tax=Penicillium alfredii TaxID=1506179 RepID=A0A9W9GBE4_9EURO|nr:polynucleotide 3'-phosphatase [Penicillium alfredii]KAJ5115027.1 polynucleotide 3'-phosphatase [Penicillium alfredii]
MGFFTQFVRVLVFFLCCLQLALAASNFQLVEHLENVPSGWSKGGRPSPSTRMTFRLAIAQTQTAAFEQRVIDLSTPGHRSYGQHMKRDQVQEFLRPSHTVSDQVLAWLRSEDVPSDSIEANSHWISFKIPISQAERMLNTQFFYFNHHITHTTAIRSLDYSVPGHIHPHIQLIQPTTRFGHPSPQRTLPLNQPIVATSKDLTADCATAIKPDCLRDLYELDSTTTSPDIRNRLGVSGFLEQYARHGDFDQFMHRFAPNQTDSSFTTVSINGGLNEQDSFTDGVPLVPEADQPNASDSSNEPYLDQLHYLVNLPDEELPAILSTSYGEAEQSVPASYARATCNLYAQLGARGVSVIFSSGDSGVGGSCLSNDGSNRTTFLPGFPASCPFVTSVGGTYGNRPEKAIDFSGGGFSDIFALPTYQNQAVDGYLDRVGDRWKGLYNPQGRGIPDVAAQASNFIIRDHDTYLKISGTSAAAPVFAAVVSQLNAARLANGQPRMGFLNPWLYSLGRPGITDIVDGGSRGCYGSTDEGVDTPHVPYASWNATEGWDPATGLGTPSFRTLVRLALNTSEK